MMACTMFAALTFWTALFTLFGLISRDANLAMYSGVLTLLFAVLTIVYFERSDEQTFLLRDNDLTDS